MKKTAVILTTLVLIFTACKKENPSPDTDSALPPPNQNSTADFTITPAIVNYPIGTTWAYSLTVEDYQYVNTSSANPNLSYSYTTNSTYTVTVVRDTIITPAINGKIVITTAAGMDNVTTYIREVWYYDPANFKWHDIVYQKYNGGTETVNCFGVDLPLTTTSAWQNTHPNHLSTGIDSCFARGFETINCGLGNVKCIKFETNSTATFKNTYWYNNQYCKIKSIASSYLYDSGAQTLTGKNNIILLTAFHN